MKLTFNELMRLLLLVSGIVFFGVGVWMIKDGVAAEGSIDIRSAFLTGSLKTGSAGLFVAFFAFFMILTSVMFSHRTSIPAPVPGQIFKSRMRVFVPVILILWAIAVVMYLIERNTAGSEQILFGWLTAFFGVSAFIFSIGTFVEYMEETEAARKG
jgi:hypothetical protein